MKRLIITTVGTSITTNPKLISSDFKHEVNTIKRGIKPRHYEKCVRQTVRNLTNVFNQPHFSNDSLSAELASICVLDKSIKLKNDDVIALLATDTKDGIFCAEVNKKAMESLDLCKICGPYEIEGLKIKGDENIAKDFVEKGFINFQKEVEKIIKENEVDGTKYFNITGGFKGIIPSATILAIENGMILIYLYEESKNLITMDLSVSSGKIKCNVSTTEEGSV